MSIEQIETGLMEATSKISKVPFAMLLSSLFLAACAATIATSVHATEDFCAVVLKIPDGFLALREGPGTRFDVKARLKQGDVLLADTRSCVIDHPDICDEKREWTYVYSVRHEGDEVKAQGWVARRFIQEFVCPE
jgi:hypothetical protein